MLIKRDRKHAELHTASSNCPKPMTGDKGGFEMNLGRSDVVDSLIMSPSIDEVLDDSCNKMIRGRFEVSVILIIIIKMHQLLL